jgi:tetratricopeptide (TPR) repeat protein
MLEKAIQKEPKNNEARLKLAELYYLQSMLTQCDKTLDEAIKLQKHNPKAYLIKAFMYKDMQDTTAYLRMLQLVIDQDPKEVKAYLELGNFYQKTLNPIAASYYQNALNVDPNNVEIHYNLGKLYQDLEQYTEAEQEYKTAIQLEPQHVPSLNNLGYMYLDEPFNRYEDAVKLFTQAIQAKPDFVYTVCNRGVAYEYLGQYDKARKDYEQALKLKTNFEPAIKGLNRLDEKQSK